MKQIALLPLRTTAYAIGFFLGVFLFALKLFFELFYVACFIIVAVVSIRFGWNLL